LTLSLSDEEAIHFYFSSDECVQIYRSYSGNFKRLCDVVRCCLVLDTPEDLINFVKVFKRPPITRHASTTFCFYTLQKLFCHAKLAEDSSRPVLDGVASLWNMMLVRGLGLIPIREHLQEKDDQACAAFEILRVSAVQLSD
jgi:hypothetical protein